MFSQRWNGFSFEYPIAENAKQINNNDYKDFASLTHIHTKKDILDFNHNASHFLDGSDPILPKDIGALSLLGGEITGQLILKDKLSFGEKINIEYNNNLNLTMPIECSLMINNNKVWDSGNLNPKEYSLLNHNHKYNVNDDWLKREDNTSLKFYGNTNQLVFKTDGEKRYTDSVSDSPFIFMYGGDFNNNKLAYINSVGDLWTKASGLLSTNINKKIDKVSTIRNGVDRIYRSDDDSDYSVKVVWEDNLWKLKGYQQDMYHSGCYVDKAGSLLSPKKINGIAFDGTKDINISVPNTETVNGNSLWIGINDDYMKLTKKDNTIYVTTDLKAIYVGNNKIC